MKGSSTTQKNPTTREKIVHSLDHGVLSYVIQTLILISVVSFTLETMEWAEQYSATFAIFDFSITVIFCIEISVRLLVYDKPLRYLISFHGIVDLVSILPALAGLDSKGFRIIRLFRLLKLARSERVNSATNRLFKAFEQVKTELFIFSIIVFLLIYFSAVGIYLFENQVQPNAFSSIPAAMWWALATLTTVGYGDVYPITPGGKIFASLIILIGVGIVAIPTGLFATALATLKESDDDSSL